MKRSLLLPSLVLLVALVILLASSAAGPPSAPPLAPVSVFFVRHAETASSTRTNRDPELSAVGISRGHALAQLLKTCGATHLFASEFQRTQSTLAELAKVCGLEVTVIAANDGEAQLATLRALPAGAVAVVCGHSNTVPTMVAGLGGEIADLKDLPAAQQVFAHDAYQRLILVVLPATEAAAAKTIELRYGADPVAAALAD
jgi:phosphohistidine phosphatase SixA